MNSPRPRIHPLPPGGIRESGFIPPCGIKSGILFVILAFVICHSAPAAVIYVENANVPIPQNMDGVYLNVFTGAVGTVDPGSAAPWINPFYGGVYVGSSALFCPVVTGPDQLLNVASGQMINGGQSYAAPASGSSTHMGGTAGQFQPNTPGYIGFQMKTSPSSDTYYGWMQVSFNNTGAGSILSYAYENSPGTGIAAGFTAVPEPGRAALVLLGLVGLLLRRRRVT